MRRLFWFGFAVVVFAGYFGMWLPLLAIGAGIMSVAFVTVYLYYLMKGKND